MSYPLNFCANKNKNYAGATGICVLYASLGNVTAIKKAGGAAPYATRDKPPTIILI